jgi:hypothetical protein
LSEVAATLHSTWSAGFKLQPWLKFSTPKIMESSGFYSLERKKKGAFMMTFNSIFACQKKNLNFVAHSSTTQNQE